MKTDRLIDALVTQAGPVQRRTGAGALALALLVGTPLSYALMERQIGLNPDLAAFLREPMFWVKFGFGVALAIAALWLVLRLVRPGVRAGRVRWAVAAPAIVLWVLAALALAAAPRTEWPVLLLGSSWAVCPTNIASLSAPVFIGALLALRTMAPTKLATAGAAAGLFAGGVGTAVYALHCPELAAPFLALWYVLGALLPAGLGALIGPRVLRW